MRCPRCGNEDLSWFYLGSKGWYCRKCINFKRVLLNDDFENVYPDSPIVDADYHLRFNLTAQQQLVSNQILHEYLKGNSILVHAVCGSGKTELVYQTISYCLNHHQRVGFAISRRQVVIQLAQRFSIDFPYLKVVPVCQGYTNEVEGDLIICTTHQLYRYPNRFDLLIIDEPDAFPFSGNEVLHGIVATATKGTNIYLSATPDKWLLDQIIQHKCIEISLYIRPSRIPLAIPKIKLGPSLLLPFFLFWYLIRQHNNNRYTLVFFPTIKLTNFFYHLFKYFFPIKQLTSHTQDKETPINSFIKHEIFFLFCTSILERGVTFSGIDLIIYQANHSVFSASSLVQIMGRLGRDINHPKGDGIFLCSRKSSQIEQAKQLIIQANTIAYGAEKI